MDFIFCGCWMLLGRLIQILIPRKSLDSGYRLSSVRGTFGTSSVTGEASKNTFWFQTLNFWGQVDRARLSQASKPRDRVERSDTFLCSVKVQLKVRLTNPNIVVSHRVWGSYIVKSNQSGENASNSMDKMHLWRLQSGCIQPWILVNFPVTRI